MDAITYLSAWKTISARIKGLQSAAQIHAAFLAAENRSQYGADKDLQKHCEGILAIVEQFKRDFGALLPAAANEAIDSFLQGGDQIRRNSGGDAILTRTIIVKLIAFEANMTYCLDNPLERVRQACELAFVHLQRLIVVDEDYRKKWQTAYSVHETHCERLGGVHLLWHGIWAFKVDANGGKTDLVYQEPLVTSETPVALGVILTEWKRGNGKPAVAFEAAKEQAKLYSSGILAGLELVSPRYLILVTAQQITPPADLTEAGIIYRHINIAVDPEPPADAAKRLAKERGSQ